MWRMTRGLIYLAILGVLVVAGFALLGDLSPQRSETRGTVILDGR